MYHPDPTPHPRPCSSRQEAAIAFTPPPPPAFPHGKYTLKPFHTPFGTFSRFFRPLSTPKDTESRSKEFKTAHYAGIRHLIPQAFAKGRGIRKETHHLSKQSPAPSSYTSAPASQTRLNCDTIDVTIRIANITDQSNPLITKSAVQTLFFFHKSNLSIP